MPHSVDHIGMF